MTHRIKMTDTNIKIIRKEKFKEYLFPGMIGGFLLGLFIFLFSIIDNSFKESVKMGMGWMGIILLFAVIGFFSEEWYQRKRKLKKLQSGKYRELLNLGLKINNDLDLAGNINDFYVKFYLDKKYVKPNKYIDKHYANIYCFPQSFEGFQEVIDRIKNIPEVQNAGWGFGTLTLIYEENTENLVSPIELSIDYLKEASILPLSKSEWDKTFGKELKWEREKEEKARTKQILKIGKLDIKYIKNKN